MKSPLFSIVMMCTLACMSVACAEEATQTTMNEEATEASAAPSPSEAEGAVNNAVKAKADEPPLEPAEIVLWHAYRGLEKEGLEAVIKAFHASQDVIKVRAQAVPYDPFVDKVTITIPRGQGPDIFIFAHNMVGSWVEEGLLEPISSYVKPELLGSFEPQAVKALVHQKNLYGLPMAFKSLALFYDKARLPTPPTSMEGLIEAVKPMVAAEKGLYGLVYEAGLLYFHAPWMHAFGGSVFDGGGKPAFDSTAQLDAARFARSLHKEHGITPKGMTGFMVTSHFNDKKAVAVLNGPWFRAEIKGVDYGVVPIPSVAGKTPKPFLGVEALFVSSKSELKRHAVKLAEFIAGPEGATIRLEKGKQVVAHKATLAAGAKGDPVLETFRVQANDAELMPSTPEMQLVWATADQAITGVVFGDKEPEAAFKKAQVKVVDDLSKRGK